MKFDIMEIRYYCANSTHIVVRALFLWLATKGISMNRNPQPVPSMLLRLMENLPDAGDQGEYDSDSQTRTHRDGAIPSPKKHQREN